MEIKNEKLGWLLFGKDPYTNAINDLKLADIGREWINNKWMYYCSKTEKQIAQALIDAQKHDLSLWVSFGSIDRYDMMKVIHDGIRMLLVGIEDKVLRRDTGNLMILPDDQKWLMPNQLTESGMQKVLLELNTDLYNFRDAIDNKRFYSFNPQDYGKALQDPSLPLHIRSIYKSLSAANKAFHTDARSNGVLAFQHIMNAFVHKDNAMTIGVMDYIATSAVRLIPGEDSENEKEAQGEKISANQRTM